MRRVAVLTKNGNCLTVIIPRDVRAALRWDIGDPIAMFVVGDALVVKSAAAAIDAIGRDAGRAAQLVGVEPAEVA